MRIIIHNRAQFPKCIRHFTELKGICIGECINRDGIFPLGTVAHAHIYTNDQYHGWVCLMYKTQLKEKYTLLHEVAHIITHSRALDVPFHGKAWRKVVREIGGTFRPYSALYNKNVSYQNYSHTDPIKNYK